MKNTFFSNIRTFTWLCLLISLVFFTFFTLSGLQSTFWLLHRLLPGELSTTHLQGRLFDNIAFQTLRYRTHEFSLTLHNGTVQWKLPSLSHRKLHVRAVDIKEISLHFTGKSASSSSSSSTESSETTPTFIPLQIDDLKLEKMMVNNVAVGQIHASLSNDNDIAITWKWKNITWPLDAPSPTSSLSLESPSGELKLQGRWPDMHLIATTKINAPIKTTITAKGFLHNIDNGGLLIDIAPSIYQTRQEKNSLTIPFQGASFQATLNTNELRVKSHFALDKEQQGDILLQLPHFHLNTFNEQQMMYGKLNFVIPSLAFLNTLNEKLQIQGKLKASLALDGTLAQPNLTGKLELSDAQCTIPDTGITLNPIHATLESHDKHWQVTGVLHTSVDQALTLQGKGDFSPIINGALTLNGEKIRLINTPEYVIDVSPNLIFSFKPQHYELTGNVLIPYADIKPLTFSDTISLTDDATFVTEQTSHTDTAFNITTNVKLIMGDSVQINAQGLRGFLNGSLTLTQKPTQPLNANGTLTLRDGRYQAYGQNLSLENSELTFSGETIENPMMHVRAVRYFNQKSTSAAESSQLFDFKSTDVQSMTYGDNIRVGIDVHGRLKNPKISLFSTPATLSQADILSMLLLGKPASQANRSGGKLLISALSALNLDSGTKGAKLIQQLKNTLNIDVDVQNNSNSSSINALGSNTSVGVGKSLTERLYLHYSIDLFQDNSNVLTLTYLLNKFFSIQVSASDIGNGIDLLYTQSHP